MKSYQQLLDENKELQKKNQLLVNEGARLMTERDRWRAACNSPSAEHRIRELEEEVARLKQDTKFWPYPSNKGS